MFWTTFWSTDERKKQVPLKGLVLDQLAPTNQSPNPF